MASGLGRWKLQIETHPERDAGRPKCIPTKPPTTRIRGRQKTQTRPSQPLCSTTDVLGCLGAFFAVADVAICCTLFTNCLHSPSAVKPVADCSQNCCNLLPKNTQKMLLVVGPENGQPRITWNWWVSAVVAEILKDWLKRQNPPIRCPESFTPFPS